MHLQRVAKKNKRCKWGRRKDKETSAKSATSRKCHRKRQEKSNGRRRREKKEETTTCGRSVACLSLVFHLSVRSSSRNKKLTRFFASPTLYFATSITFSLWQTCTADSLSLALSLAFPWSALGGTHQGCLLARHQLFSLQISTQNIRNKAAVQLKSMLNKKVRHFLFVLATLSNMI
jgi:hypothetical protein